MSDRIEGSAQTLSIRFVGSGSEYFRIWIVNLLLILVTAGLYYPFAKVRRLRYFHGCTELDGHPLAFHGNPWAMLRGYALVLVLSVVYGFAQRSSPLAAGVALVVLMAIGPALWQSSLRFRLSNTSWRGIRLHFGGSLGGAYAASWPGYALFAGMVVLGWLSGSDPSAKEPPAALALLPLVLMLAMPWLLWRAKRYQHDNYGFATEHTTFTARASAFYGVFLRTGLLSMALGAAILAVAGLVAPGLFGSGRLGKPGPGTIVLYLVVLVLAAMLFQVLLRSYFTSRMQNLLWNHTASRNLHLASRLQARRLAAVTAKNWLLMLATLGLYYPFAAVATARLRLQAVSVDCRTDIDQLLADPRAAAQDAAGDAAADVLGVDIGL